MAPNEDPSNGAVLEQNQAEEPARFPKALKDPSYRRKFVHTAWLCGLQFVLGVRRCQAGVTFLDLQIITKTNVEKASVFFTAGSLGETVGSFLPGLIGKRVNANLLLLLSSLGLGISVVIIPYCSNYALMLAAQFLASFFMGIMQTCCSSEVLRVWEGQGHTSMQMTYCIFALGGIVTPLFTDPFLSEKTKQFTDVWNKEKNSSLHGLVTTVRPYYQVPHATSFPVYEGDTVFVYTEQTVRDSYLEPMFGNLSGSNFSADPDATRTNVHYAFLINGVLCVIASLPFLVLLLKAVIRNDRQRVNRDPKDIARKRGLPRLLKYWIYSCLFVFFVLFICCDDIFVSYLMTFIVREFRTSKHSAAQVVMMAWLAYGFTNCLMVFVSKVASPVKILILCFSALAVILPAFAIASWLESITAFTVITVAYGISAAPIFPTTLVWADAELIPVPGFVMAVIFTGTGLGPLITPLFIGYLMENVDNLWFCYMMFIYGLCVICVFWFLFSLNRFYINVRHGPLTLRQTYHTGTDEDYPSSSTQLQVEFEPNDEKL